MNELVDILIEEFSNKHTEDLVFMQEERVYKRDAREWKQITKDFEPLLYKKNFYEICHLITETAGISLGPRTPSADTLINFSPQVRVRAHIVSPPLSAGGIQITLRKSELQNNEEESLFIYESPDEKEKITAAFKQRDNILIIGPTGAGKTTFLKSLLSKSHSCERIAILEDSAEIPTPNEISYKLVSRSNRFAAQEGSTWNLDQLLYESLRMRPDRIVIGELRGPEALGLVHAIQSGHRGVMSTMHATDPATAKERFKNLAQLSSSKNLEINSAKWDQIVQISLSPKGERLVKVHSF